jgi:ribonuclease-3
MNLNKLSPLMRKIGYVFKEPAFLRQALTHRSHAEANNERLEFLGDSILNFLISAELYQRFPRLDEGELSRLRASLVKGETLAVIAQELGLGEYLQLGPGELKSGGFRRPSILADAFEALIAAIYLDSNIGQCQIFIRTFFAKKLADLSVLSHQKDPKTALQEYLQAKKMPLPQYLLLNTSGEDHEQQFELKCIVEGVAHESLAVSSSRRQAEQIAAEAFLLFLQTWKKK